MARFTGLKPKVYCPERMEFYNQYAELVAVFVKDEA